MADKTDKSAEPAVAVAQLEDVKVELNEAKQASAQAKAEGETQEESAAGGAPEASE
jgi:hypothetical protein